MEGLKIITISLGQKSDVLTKIRTEYVVNTSLERLFADRTKNHHCYTDRVREA
jgi:hypothetical protein